LRREDGMQNNLNKTLAMLFLSLSIVACSGSSEDENTDPGVPNLNATHQVLAFNDLGMHCADLDYSTFVILPPFNVVHSQVDRTRAINLAS
jgi:hypothetical protein